MNKNLSGVMSVVPLITFIFYILAIMADPSGETMFGTVCFLFFLCIVFAFVDTIWFIIFACKKSEWPLEKKIIWAIVLYSFNMLVFPVFWWLYIREE